MQLWNLEVSSLTLFPVVSQLEIQLNHGDTVTLSYTGITSMSFRKRSVPVVKKVN